MKTSAALLVLVPASLVLFGCAHNPEKTAGQADALEVAEGAFASPDFTVNPKLFALLEVEQYGPFYSRPIYTRDSNGRITRERRFCFTITHNNAWKVKVKYIDDRDGDHKMDAWVEDTDGDGKWDKGKTDSPPRDGKFDRSWTDANGDGVPQPNEITNIDPPEPAPNMPGWF